MKIYLTHPDTLSSDAPIAIQKYLNSQNHKIETRKKASDYSAVTFENAKKAFINNTKCIKNADIVIAEISDTNSDIGYEVSFALEEKKPVIAMYSNAGQEHGRHTIPTALMGNPARHLMLREYELRNIDKTLELAIRDALELIDTKFILIIPPHIDSYLEWNVKERGRAKADITREALERTMKEDKEYQTYITKNSSNQYS